MSPTAVQMQKLKEEISKELKTELREELKKALTVIVGEELNAAEIQKLERISRSLDEGKRRRVFSNTEKLRSYLDSFK